MLTVTQMNAMDVNELIDLNKKLVAIIKEKQRMNNRTATFAVKPGAQVSFMSNRFKQKVSGTVIEVKRTKVVVDIGSARYLVPASMLKVD